MADTFTPNINLTKPEVGASDDTWGDKLNANADLIDAAFQTVLPLDGGTVTGVITVKRAGVDMLRLHNTDYSATDYGSVRAIANGAVAVVSAIPTSAQYVFDNALAAPASDNHVITRWMGDARYVPPERTVATGDGLTGGGPLSDNLTLSVGPSVARSGTAVGAGVGLIGGGTLGAPFNLAMGQPSDITRTSTNSATGNTHSHSLSGSSFRDMLANYVIPGTIGSTIFAANKSGVGKNKGDTIAGSNLRAAGVWNGNTDESPNSETGTWVCFGKAGPDYSTTWLRVA